MAVNNTNGVFFHTLMFVLNQSIIQEESSYNYYLLNIGKAEMNATKCYGIYGCFELSPPWTSEHRPVSLFPEDLRKIEPNYPLFTRNNPSKPVFFNLNDFDAIKSSGIDPNLPLYVISHGYMEGGDRVWCVGFTRVVNPPHLVGVQRGSAGSHFYQCFQEGNIDIRIRDMVQELLAREDCSVILVDWRGGSGPPYTQAVANIRLLGAVTAHLIADFAKYTGRHKLEHVHCIGHSLGSHLCAYVGYTLQKDFQLKLGRITGMDPAEPHFAKSQPPIRLDRSAAYYVDVIHTDASAFIRGGLGMTERIGHVDYYPNGGTDQPGCGKSMIQYISAESGSFYRGIRKFLGCNHIRSYEFFTESINPKCNFMTISCSSYEDFKVGKCFECGKNGQHCLTFGYHGRRHYQRLLDRKILKPRDSLVQFLMTGDQKPFCRAHYRITVNISSSNESRLHGGEIGQLWFKFYSRDDRSGGNSGRVALNEGGYHEPGAQYRYVIAAHGTSDLKSVEVEWKYYSNVFNPLTWRILVSPRIYVTKVTIDALETKKSITVCPEGYKPLVSGAPQIMLPSYCT